MACKLTFVFLFVLCRASDLITATGTRLNRLSDDAAYDEPQDETLEHPGHPAADVAAPPPPPPVPHRTEAHTFRLTVLLVGTIFGVALACSFVAPKVAMPMLYLSANVGIDITISAQRTHIGSSADVYAFDPLCVMVVVETVKFIFSAAMYWRNSSRKATSDSEHEVLSKEDVAYFALPAAMFTFANVLTYWAMGANDMSVFMLFRDSMVIWTALTWWAVFGARPNKTRMTSLFVISLGLVLNRVGSFYEGAPWSWSFLWVVLMTLCVAFGSVSFEFALKRNVSIDIHLQNTLFFGLCAVFSLALLLIMDPLRLTSPAAFFRGFTRWTFLTCCMFIVAGISAAYLLKFTDAVFKIVAICLRGPLMLCLAAFTPLLSAQVDYTTVIPATIVVGGCFNYLSQGKMQAPAAAQAAEKEKKDLF